MSLALTPSQRRGRPDYVLLIVTAMIVCIGALMVYSASFVVAHNEFHDDSYFLVRQLIWSAVGSVFLLIGLNFDYRRWRVLSLAVMLASIVLLVLVFVPGIGASSYGAVRWIKLGPFMELQPSEIAKLAVVIYLADWLARRGSLVQSFSRGVLPFGIIVGIIAMLVFVQPDLGTTTIIVSVAACIFFVAGARLAHIALGLVGAAGAGALVLSHLTGYQGDRIQAFLDPWKDLQGSGWHTAQGLIALGSGGPLGLGLGNSLQKYYWVPNAHTDAIFAIIGEELGFIGCVVVLGLFVALAWRGFRIAWRCRDPFGRLLATGITCMLTLQALVNIAVVTNTLPYTGVTLPFVSFGGNSTVVSLAAVGILLNISRFGTGPARERGASVETDVPDGESPMAQRTGRLLREIAHRSGRRVAPRPAKQRSTPVSEQARPARPRASGRRRSTGRRHTGLHDA